MKTRFLPVLIAVSLLLAGTPASAAEKGDAKAELQALVTKIQAKLRELRGAEKAVTEKDLADNLKEFDQLLAAHKGEKSDDVAQLLVMKALLYVQVLEDDAKGLPLLKQVKTDFPETRPGKQMDELIAGLERQSAARKLQKDLVTGAKFPAFDVKDTAGKRLALADFKGKVVLVDFWATWCGPCVAELPNVLAAYEKHHAKGLEIIGVSLDRDREKLASFTKERKMAWAQVFDGDSGPDALAARYGITSIPATFLLDGEGKIIAKNLRGDELETAVAKALGKK